LGRYNLEKYPWEVATWEKAYWNLTKHLATPLDYNA